MTPELLDQRRWQRIAEMFDVITTDVVMPVVMPHSEGGGILIIYEGRAFHFFNFKAAVNVDVAEADTGKVLEERCNCFRFDMPLEEAIKKVAWELLREDL